MSEQIIPLMKDQCEISQFQQMYNCYDVYIDEEIREVSYYRNVLQILRNGIQGDLIRLHISSPGGSLTSAVVLRNAIKDCQADVVAVIEAEAYSAASLIALSCPAIEVKPYATMMCHSASFGSSGSVQNVRDHVEFTGRHAEAVMEEVYKEFLTPLEFEDLQKGCELWFDYDQINERLEQMFENRECSEEQEEMKSLNELIAEAVEASLHKVLDARERALAESQKKAVRKAVVPKKTVEKDTDNA